MSDPRRIDVTVVLVRFKLALSLLIAIAIVATPTQLAAGPEPEICRRLQALESVEAKLPTSLDLLMRERLGKKELCTKRFWSTYRPKPLDQVLTGAERLQYHKALDSQDCDLALKLLSERFEAAHPDAPSHLSDEVNSFYWRINVAKRHYSNLGMCDALQSIRRSKRKIIGAQINARPFSGLQKSLMTPAFNKLPVPVQSMYSAIGDLHDILARSRNSKVALALLRLSVEGEALKYHPHYELYLAHRLRILGHTEPVIDAVINRRLDPAVRANIEGKATRHQPVGIPMFAD
ncbi:MAG: hypothetical protein AAGG72_00355 [Pseudomonadota bacterium]